MNIRKPVDYSMMYAAIDTLMVSNMEQTKLFCEIGRLIDERPEKGAAVAAAEYINATCPEKSGFSPRSLRRMRDFYRAYEADHDLMARAMGIGWSLNAVIIENCEEHDVRKWYVMACLEYGWSKQELLVQIKGKVHENTELTFGEIIDQNDAKHTSSEKRDIFDFRDYQNCGVIKDMGVKGMPPPFKEIVYGSVPTMFRYFEKSVSRKRTFREIFFRKLGQGYEVAMICMGTRIPLPVFSKVKMGIRLGIPISYVYIDGC